MRGLVSMLTIILILVFSGAVLAAVALTGWPGEMGRSATKFCERFAEGIVNLANLAYFLGVAMVAAAVARFSFDWRRVAG